MVMAAQTMGTLHDAPLASQNFLQELQMLIKILFTNFKIILLSLTCQQVFCIDTATLYMTKYPWLPMPATIHKMLIHAKQILENSVLPAGYFGEEASEARNKFYKRGNSTQGKIAVLIILKIFLIERWIPPIQLFLV